MSGLSWRGVLLLAAAGALVASWLHAPPVVLFVLAGAGVLPLAAWMGDATEALAERTGPALGGLLNATFGNAAELIIALVALRAGLVDLVKASITGSILGNLLLILGLSFVAGGLRRPLVRFNRTAAGASAAMLTLAVAGLVFPALFQATHASAPPTVVLHLSEAVAVILAATYAASLLFALRTHRALFAADHAHQGDGPARGSTRQAVLILAAATAGVAVLSEILVHTVDAVTHALGLGEVFIGLVIIPIIGNAAEHATAVMVARKGQMDLALQIALGSSTQVALFVAPVLVLAGVIVGTPVTLVFTSFEVMAVGLATLAIAIITLDGETHWFEGIQLLALYALIGAAAFFL